MKSAAAIADAQSPMATKKAETKAPTMTKAALEAIAEGFAKGMKPIFESYKTRIAALEQANKDLHARVLELEASHAATRMVPHGER
jgi:predicted phage tail protein